MNKQLKKAAAFIAGAVIAISTIAAMPFSTAVRVSAEASANASLEEQQKTGAPEVLPGSVTTTDDDGAEKSVGDISPTMESREASSEAESNPSVAEPVFKITPSDDSNIKSGASSSFDIEQKAGEPEVLLSSVTTTDDDDAEKSVGNISPTMESRGAPSDAEANPSAAGPIFKITPGDVSTIKSGTSDSFKVELKNLGTVKAERILVETTASEDVVLTDGSGSQDIESIEPGGTANVTISYKALNNISSAKQTFGVSLRYYYTSASGETIGTANSTVNVPARVSSSAEVTEQPLLKITGQTLSRPISAKSEYEYTLTVKNLSDTDVSDIYLFFEASDSLYFIGGTESASIDYIDGKESEDIKVRFRTMDSITAVKQSITAHMTYSYTDGRVEKTAESDSSVTIIANSTGDGSSSGGNIAVPNIIIKSYDIGAEQIAAGDSFDLALNLFNTSTITGVENVIMTINAGGSVNIFGGTNTFYYPRIGASGEISENIPLKALATAETGTSSISVSLKYDYIDSGSRFTVNLDQTIFVPVYQPDKMTFEVNVPTWSAQVGQDMYITTTYLNKGRSDISNVKAEIVGDVGALSTSKVIGTVQPGGNGSFDFIVQPYMPGTCEFVIMITYEDATLNEVTKELPVSFEVEDFMDFGMYDPGFDDPGFEDPGMENGKKFPWALLWIGIGVVVVGGVITIIVVAKHKKKKKNALTEADIDWEDEFDDNNNNNNTTTV